MALLVTIKANWKREVLVSALYAAAFILLNLVLPQITIGYPVLKVQAFGTQFAAVVLIAPVVEELVFRFLVVNFLWAMGLGTLLVVGISAALFSLFHYTAYGASLAAQNASFVGAFLFGLVAAYVAIRRGSIVTSIIIHAALNAWLLIRYSFGG